MVVMSMSEIPLEKYKQAYRKMKLEEARKGFKIHATVYGVVNAGLITLNMLTVPQVPWFIGPLVGWCIGLANHYYFGVRKAPQFIEEEEAKVQRLAEK
jgi:hypothetical protein